MKNIKFKLDRVMFRSDDNGFTIAKVIPNEKEGLQISSYGNLSIKGVMCELQEGIEYECLITDEEDSKYGKTYCVSGTRPAGMGDVNSDEEMLIFIKAMIGKSIYNKLKNVEGICNIIKANDHEELIKINGIGNKSAKKILSKWKDEGVNGIVISELLNMGFNEGHIDSLKSRYDDLSYALDRLKDNPYVIILDDVKIRIDIIDKIAFKMDINTTDIRRVEAYVYKALKDDSYKDFKSHISIDVFKKNKIIANIISRVSKFDEAVISLVNKNKVIMVENNIGLKSVYNQETKLIEEITRISNCDNGFVIKDIDSKIQKEEELVGIKLTEKQKDAVRSCLSNNFTLIKGYAGTGKTTITKIILNILEKYCDKVDIKQCALSGKAAQVLSVATDREASTIHKLLEIRDEEDDNKKKIEANVLVIDELSMVDIGLFGKLLSKLYSGTKVICMGDNNQLPSLAYGKLIDDIVLVKGVNYVSLTEVHRQALESGIIATASEIRSDNFTALNIERDVRGNMRDMFIYSDNNTNYKESIVSKMVELYEIDNKEQTQVICATSSLCYSINKEIQRNIIDVKGKFITTDASGNIPKKDGEVSKYRIFENDKIIIIKNMYGVDTPETYNNNEDEDNVFTLKSKVGFGKDDEDEKVVECNNEDLNLYNGNIGYLKEIHKEYVIVCVNDKDYVIEEDDFNNIQLAYACTCHKLQGSAADDVLILIDGGYAESYLMSNEWIYTAITRSRKSCHLYGDYRNINKSVKTRGLNKKSTFMELLLK